MRVSAPPIQALTYTRSSTPIQGAASGDKLIVKQASSASGDGFPQSLATQLGGQFDVTNLDGTQFDAMFGQMCRSGELGIDDIGSMMVLGLKWHPPQAVGGPPPTPSTGTQNLLQDARNYLEFAKQQAPNVVPSLQKLIGIFEGIKRVHEGQPSTHWLA